MARDYPVLLHSLEGRDLDVHVEKEDMEGAYRVVVRVVAVHKAEALKIDRGWLCVLQPRSPVWGVRICFLPFQIYVGIVMSSNKFERKLSTISNADVTGNAPAGGPPLPGPADPRGPQDPRSPREVGVDRRYRGQGEIFFPPNSKPWEGGAAGAAGEQMKLELVSTTDRLLALEPEWRALCEEASNAGIFTTWEWVKTWWEFFGKKVQPKVLVVRESGRGQVVGIAPFMLRRHPISGLGPFRELALLGCTAAAPDHVDVICREDRREAVTGELVEFLDRNRGDWDVIRLDGMPSGSVFLEALLRRCDPADGVVLGRACPYLTLPATWDQFLSRKDRKFRYNLRSRAKRLARDTGGKITYHQVSAIEEMEPAMREFFRLHQQRRSGNGNTDAFQSAELRRFHLELAKTFLHRGWLRLYWMAVEGRPIASIYCFRYRNVVSFYNTGFDLAYSSYGPGMAVTAHAIRASIKEGAAEFDFLRGNYEYKYCWTDQVRYDKKTRLASTTVGRWLVRTYRVGLAIRNRSAPDREL